jgi:hypothetical protein
MRASNEGATIAFKCDFQLAEQPVRRVRSFLCQCPTDNWTFPSVRNGAGDSMIELQLTMNQCGVGPDIFADQGSDAIPALTSFS